MAQRAFKEVFLENQVVGRFLRFYQKERSYEETIVEGLQSRSVGHVAQYCVQHRPAPDKKQSRLKRERGGEKEKPFYAYFKGKKGRGKNNRRRW